MSELKQQVKQVMIEHLDIADKDFDGHTSFTQQLALDSLDAMDLLMAVDEAFNVRIPVKRMESVDTLDQLVAAIEEQRNAHK